MLKSKDLGGGVLEITQTRHSDHRGFFVEAFRPTDYAHLGIEWVQDSQFFSKAGAFRGFHSYTATQNQYKLVQCLHGSIVDIAVCIDEQSDYYGRSVEIVLTGAMPTLVLVPPGFAHGVLAIKDSLVQYKTNVGNSPGAQIAISWDDPDLKVSWPGQPRFVSKERTITFKEAKFRV